MRFIKATKKQTRVNSLERILLRINGKFLSGQKCRAVLKTYLSRKAEYNTAIFNPLPKSLPTSY